MFWLLRYLLRVMNWIRSNKLTVSATSVTALAAVGLLWWTTRRSSTRSPVIRRRGRGSGGRRVSSEERKRARRCVSWRDDEGGSLVDVIHHEDDVTSPPPESKGLTSPGPVSKEDAGQHDRMKKLGASVESESTESWREEEEVVTPPLAPGLPLAPGHPAPPAHQRQKEAQRFLNGTQSPSWGWYESLTPPRQDFPRNVTLPPTQRATPSV